MAKQTGTESVQNGPTRAYLNKENLTFIYMIFIRILIVATNHINVFPIVTGMFYYSYYSYKLTVIIKCMVSSFMTGMFLFILLFF